MKTKKIRFFAASFLLFQSVLLPSNVFAVENEVTTNIGIIEKQTESHATGEISELVKNTLNLEIGKTILSEENQNQLNLQEMNAQTRDDQGPTANVTTSPVEFQATRVSDLTKEDLMRFFIDGPVDDNTPTDQIDISLLNSDGSAVSIKNTAPSTMTYDRILRLRDEANNYTDYPVKYQVVDTQAPWANIKEEVIDFSTLTANTFSRKDLLRFIIGDPQDNWTLYPYIDFELTDENGNAFNLHELPFIEHTGYLRLEDEKGNKSEAYEVKFLAGDKEGPIVNIVTAPVDFQARRVNELEREDLSRFLASEPLDNVTAPHEIKLSLHDHLGAALSIVNVAPSVTVYDAHLRLQDKVGNQTDYPVRYLVIDTEAPTARFKNETIDFSTHTSNTFSRSDLLRFLADDPEDNWSLSEKINIELVDENGNEFELNDLEVREYTGYLSLEDEEGNRSDAQEVKFLVGND
ncbi:MULTISPECIES: hypothetical protein [unclassified Enterococcus]|uniref:hypothetical protein n=1 Tax=unclassified Enterococcus TaxID=2608891 RepID=UPI001A9AE526|nr:hypothetical protein [Enterococcus sp. DIV1271a]MBO1298693.1 hypothetical protein [Enterococcus sp. DIV1271a]